MSNKEAIESLIKDKLSYEYLQLYEYLEIDRRMNEMVDKMKDSIDLHENFLDLIHSKDSSYDEIHNSNILISKLHAVVDRLYRELCEHSFKFTVIHLLPYAFYKNQT